MYPQPIEQLIKSFSQLPSIGRRSAERFVFSLLHKGKKPVYEMSKALESLMNEIQSCSDCWNFTVESPCKRCADPKRDARMLCVVSQPQDLMAFEKMGSFTGKYHVLRGLIKANANEKAFEKLTLSPLFDRIQNDTLLEEIILAFNPDLPGETTMMFLEKKITELRPELKINRLARGLPMGSDLQYADEITLENAFRYRRTHS